MTRERPARRLSRSLLPARLALAGVSTFAGIVAALHLVRRDLDPVTTVVSRYAHGPGSLLFAGALLALSGGSFALVLALWRALPPPARSRTGLALLVVWSLGSLLAAAFPVGVEGADPTFSARAHTVAVGSGFVSLTLTAFLVPLHARRDPAWAPLTTPAVLLGCGIATSLATFVLGPPALSGLTERALLAADVTWLLVLAAWVRRTGAGRTGEA